MKKYNERILPNTKENWRRIGSCDEFQELNFSSREEKEVFLRKWVKENDYPKK